MNNRMKKRTAFLLVLFLVLTGVGSKQAEAAKDMSASTIKLSKTEGSKTEVFSGTGRSVSIRKNMVLYSGYTVETGSDSYAYLMLDSSKAVKLDENTEVGIKKQGRKNEINVINGSVFFDVSKKLTSSETFNIKTSSTTMGIRGTSGIVTTKTDDSGNILSEIIVLDGTVNVQVYGVKGVDKNKIFIVNAGKKLRIENGRIYTDEVPEAVGISTQDIASFCIPDICGDESLYGRIHDETGMMKQELAEAYDENMTAEKNRNSEKESRIEEEKGAIADKKIISSANQEVTPEVTPISNPDTSTGTPTPGAQTGTSTSGTPTGTSTSGTPTGTSTSGTPTGTSTSGTPTGTSTSGTPTGTSTSGAQTGTPTPGAQAGNPTTGTSAGDPTRNTQTGTPTPGAQAGAPTTGTSTGDPTRNTP